MENIYSQNISKYQWEKRILLIKTEDIGNELYRSQLNQLKADEAGLMERKLLIYQIKGQESRVGFGVDKEWKKNETDELLEISKGNNSSFEVILIGLDGGIKLRQSRVLTKEKLFAIIDGMPMRIREIKKRKSNDKTKQNH